MRKQRKSVLSRIFDVFNIILMMLICFICLAPIVHVVFASVSEPGQLALHTGIILKPLGFTTVGYRLIFNNSVILVSYLNTLFYLAAGLCISMALTLLGGYVLSRKNLLWKNTQCFYNLYNVFQRRSYSLLYCCDKTGVIQYPMGCYSPIGSIRIQPYYNENIDAGDTGKP